MKITFLKGSNCYSHVRVSKFIRYCQERQWNIRAFCWLRNESVRDHEGRETYILQGGGFGGRKLLFFYPLWMLMVFFKFLCYKQEKDEIIFAIDFDSAFPLYLAKKFNRSLRYIYDIHDEFAIRYRLPKIIKRFIRWLDRKTRSAAELTIHVDDIRVSEIDDEYIVIHNSPEDFYQERIVDFNEPNERIFCISGLLTAGRGMTSLINFAKYSNAKFIVAGELVDDSAKAFVALPNVDYLGYISQAELFCKVTVCDAIFSLYDPSLEINRLAASNKLYDAMMLGIPVITNRGLAMTNVVTDLQCGFVVPFDYDSSWKTILNVSVKDYQQKGQNGRAEYLTSFSYESNFKKKLDVIFQPYL
ncbi:hypothetical protein [Aliivibrio sp. SR45-2]|uniref:hypothetical protein n=1 Tax=Aliivibrio sp. SR45-2 TaxID=2760931 RepID=UPI0015F8456D|nr:hypothetical protein [Aliivibrio sp. SR45-2]MBB1315836.1 hypothetical protein [Aliivibrio sp. SR45-2]